MPKIRVAVVGCGRMGRERIRCLTLWGASVATVYDSNTERAREVASSIDAEVLSDPDQLRTRHIDALFLCTPPDARVEVALACIERRIPFFVEKPVGPSARHVARITSSLKRNTLTNSVGYMLRYRESVQYARDLLARNQLIGIVAFWFCRPYGVPWWLDVCSSGGPHNEQATHLYDLCRYFGGEVCEVRTLLQDPTSMAASTALQFRSGTHGTLLYSCQANEKDIGLRIFTTAGSLFLSGWELRLVENTINGTFPDDGRLEDVFLAETSAFLDAVVTGDHAELLCDWADAVKTQELVDLAASTAEQFPGAADAR